jgi:hypothetical protein
MFPFLEFILSSTGNRGVPSSASTTTPLSWGWSPYSDASSPASSVQNPAASPSASSPQPAGSSTKISWADDSPTSGNSWWDGPPPGLERNHGHGVPDLPTSPSDPSHTSGSPLDGGDAAGFTISPSLVETMEKLAVDDSLDPELTYVAPWEQEQVEKEPIWAGVESAATVEVSESLWNDEEVKKVVPQAVCIAHGVICKKGICQEYSNQMKEARRAKEKLDREIAKAEKEKRKKASGKGYKEGKRLLVFGEANYSV